MNSTIRNIFRIDTAPIPKGKSLASYELALFIVFAIVVIFLASHHEIWRDEMRAMSIVRESGSLWELLENIRNEGHPFLWYAILWIAATVSDASVVLKIVAGVVGLLSVFVFLKSPYFSRLEKSLFVVGVFPLYEYSVQCRNYGIGMLFLFLFCANYPKRFERPIITGAILFLLANTSYYGFLLASSLLFVLFLELLLRWDSDAVKVEVISGLAIAILGYAVAALQMYPDSSTLVTNVHRFSVSDIADTFAESIIHPVSFATDAFSIRFDFSPLYVLVPLSILLLPRPLSLCFLLMMSFGMTLPSI